MNQPGLKSTIPGVNSTGSSVKTHCLLRAAASLMRDEDKGSEGGRRRRGDWQQSPIGGGLGLEVVCKRDQ